MRAPRWRLFPKYATLIIALVGGVLVASGGVGLYFSWRENQDHLVALQFEKALAAATRIEQYVQGIESHLSWTSLPGIDANCAAAPHEPFSPAAQLPSGLTPQWNVAPGSLLKPHWTRLSMKRSPRCVC